jgi:hypothetical protein
MFNPKKNHVEFELIWIDRTRITCSVLQSIIRHFTGNFENKTPESDTTISGFVDNNNKKNNPDRPNLDFFGLKLTRILCKNS